MEYATFEGILYDVSLSVVLLLILPANSCIYIKSELSNLCITIAYLFILIEIFCKVQPVFFIYSMGLVGRILLGIGMYVLVCRYKRWCEAEMFAQTRNPQYLIYEVGVSLFLFFNHFLHSNRNSQSLS